MKTIKMTTVIALLLITVTNVMAQTTDLTIRARAKDAKFIGTKHAKAYGEVIVHVYDAVTGKLLAEGVTEGDSGDTKLLLEKPINRYDRLTADSTAKFVAKLNINEPTLVTITAQAPSNKKKQKVSHEKGFKYETKDAIIASTQTWVIPGRHITGEGLLLEIPGLIVDIENPAEKGALKLSAIKDGQLIVKNHLALQCGCVITPGGIWDANTIEVRGLLKYEGIKQEDILFKYDSPSTFTGIFSKVLKKGRYTLQVYAFDRVTNNTGAETITFTVE
ncbi:hypothetical protein [Sphingobacterium sp. LRF_L2]|uniref:hypothetical protein n=1 Tax=Sphingobacterium sp. LRF_L2 TaxID=3369421 RepID=UPI003F5DBF62